MLIQPPASLVQYLTEGRCVLFVGAGLSAAAGLPGWGDLLKGMIEVIRADDSTRSDLGELQRLFETGRFLQVADYCKDRLGKTRYHEYLAKRLQPTSTDTPEAHQHISRLPFRAVVTTNYDSLLEDSFFFETRRRPKAPTHADKDVLGTLLFDRAFFILKAHGDINRPATVVLTARDYREIIYQNPAFNAMFAALLMTNAVLFLGYSLGDPDLNLLLDSQLSAFSDQVPPRYALMMDVGEVQRTVMKQSAGIDVQSFPKGEYDSVPKYLGALVQEVQKRSDQGQAASRGGLSARPDTGSRGLEDVSFSSPTSGGVDFSIRPIIQIVELSLHQRGNQLEARVTTPEQGVVAEGFGRFPTWADLESILGHSAKSFHIWDEDIANRTGQVLASCMPQDVMRALVEVPEGTILTLRLSTETETIPWEWTEVGGQFLCVRYPVARAPVGIADAARGYPQLDPGLRVLLIGDPLGSMPGAEREVKGIAAAYSRRPSTECQTLVGSEATFQAVVSRLAGEDYDIVHFAGHAWYDRREAYLMLHDQAVIRANELRSFLGIHPPAIMVLNSHFTAFVPPGVHDADVDPVTRTLIPKGFAPGPDSRGQPGFTGMTSAVGVGALVGCFGSPGDEMGADIGLKLHEELIAGQPIAIALHRARLSALSTGGNDRSALIYTLSGYPDLALPTAGD